MWTTRPRVDWNRVEALERKIPAGITPYSNWAWLKTQLDRTSKASRQDALEEYVKTYTEHKPVIDEAMNLIFSDVPSNWFDITIEKMKD